MEKGADRLCVYYCTYSTVLYCTKLYCTGDQERTRRGEAQKHKQQRTASASASRPILPKVHLSHTASLGSHPYIEAQAQAQAQAGQPTGELFVEASSSLPPLPSLSVPIQTLSLPLPPNIDHYQNFTLSPSLSSLHQFPSTTTTTTTIIIPAKSTPPPTPRHVPAASLNSGPSLASLRSSRWPPTLHFVTSAQHGDSTPPTDLA